MLSTGNNGLGICKAKTILQISRLITDAQPIEKPLEPEFNLILISGKFTFYI